MSSEQETKSVKPLADLIGIDFGEAVHLSGHPERIDEGMEEKLERISRVSNNAEDEILNGIEVIGHLMWHAGSYDFNPVKNLILQGQTDNTASGRLASEFGGEFFYWGVF